MRFAAAGRPKQPYRTSMLTTAHSVPVVHADSYVTEIAAT
jgi:hypothetical protein